MTLGAFICLFWTAGLVKSYGVIFAEMMKIYPEEIRSVPVYRLREAAKKTLFSLPLKDGWGAIMPPPAPRL